MYALEKPLKFLKNETQKFYSGGVFVLGGFCSGAVFVGGFMSGGFCPRTLFLKICLHALVRKLFLHLKGATQQ